MDAAEVSHNEQHPLAGWIVTVRLNGQHHQVEVEDYAERVCGRFPGLLYGHDTTTRLACLFCLSEIVCSDVWPYSASPRSCEAGGRLEIL